MSQKIQNSILKIIGELSDKKKSNNVFPEYAMSIDVFRKMQEANKELSLKDYETAINELVKKERIEFGRTVNSIHLKLKQ